MDQDDVETEQQSYLRIAEALRRYRTSSIGVMAQRKRDFDNLHVKYKELLGDHTQMFQAWKSCLEANADFLETISRVSTVLFECYWPGGMVKPLYENPTALDMDKVISTLKQFVRDWGEEGAEERKATYTPIYEALERYIPNREDRLRSKVLVPGSGLSRLAFELSLRGFQTQGNEFSHHMLIAGHFLLNHVQCKNQLTIYPYADQSVNVLNRADQMRPIQIPDLCPAEAVQELDDQGLAQGDFSMVAGDFLEVYNKPSEIGTWTAVVTCFFIDTAHNVFEYIETIHRLLAPGGVWINIGPLLYHFSDSPDEMSIDLSYDELRSVITKYGFTIDEERRMGSCYTANARSMKWTLYNCIFFAARKTGEPQTPSADQFAVRNPHIEYAERRKQQQQPLPPQHEHQHQN
eukprot:TRINITY_DN4544_c2_g1_i1.p1 TRINITY_DN4544_c2_g1~~TRINITY_DN4544_c2_g1_i1.p1  ORF type:complete len:433 (+),score=91.61 TRINITY_DN4544_c2_g1_i1:83-1300(+)